MKAIDYDIVGEIETFGKILKEILKGSSYFTDQMCEDALRGVSLAEFPRQTQTLLRASFAMIHDLAELCKILFMMHAIDETVCRNMSEIGHE